MIVQYIHFDYHEIMKEIHEEVEEAEKIMSDMINENKILQKWN